MPHPSRIQILLLLPSIYGCSLVVPSINDLQFESAQIVRREDIRVAGLLSPATAPYPKYLKVRFTSTRSMGHIARNNGLNVYANATFCPPADTLSSGVSIWGPYLQDLTLDFFFDDEEWNSYKSVLKRDIAGRYGYDVYVVLVRDRSQVHSAPYDLSKDDRDICVTIGGGNMLGAGFESNAITVPKDAISRALKLPL